MTDPKRGEREAALSSRYESDRDFEYKHQVDWKAIPKVFRVRTNLLVFSQV